MNAAQDELIKQWVYKCGITGRGLFDVFNYIENGIVPGYLQEKLEALA